MDKLHRILKELAQFTTLLDNFSAKIPRRQLSAPLLYERMGRPSLRGKTTLPSCYSSHIAPIFEDAVSTLSRRRGKVIRPVRD